MELSLTGGRCVEGEKIQCHILGFTGASMEQKQSEDNRMKDEFEDVNTIDFQHSLKYR